MNPTISCLYCDDNPAIYYGSSCRYCEDTQWAKTKPACQATSPTYICTRPQGHDGQHMACGYLTHPIATWDQEEGLTEMEAMASTPAGGQQ